MTTVERDGSGSADWRALHELLAIFRASYTSSIRMMFGLGKKRVERLAEKGFGFLNDEEYEAALQVAGELEQKRFTAGFEIAALAHAGLGDLDGAIAVLERGVEFAPAVWINWQLLGNYYSDTERFEKAREAYARASECEGVLADSVRLNQAILENRTGNYSRAEEIVSEITDNNLVFQKPSVLNTAYLGMNRPKEALTVAQDALDSAKSDLDPEVAGELIRGIAEARLALDESKESVKGVVLALINSHGPSHPVLTLLRNLDGQYSERARYLRFLFHGVLSESDPMHGDVKGFFSSVDVVAESVDEAIEYIQALQDVDLASFEADELEDIEPRPSDPKGVYRMSGRSFYEDEE